MLNFMSRSLNWEITFGCPGNEVGRYFETVDETLEYCGRVFYANSLFDLLRMRVRHLDGDVPKAWSDPWDDKYPAASESPAEWGMAILSNDGRVRCRQLENKHEVFGMLMAELKLGSVLIQVHRSSPC